MAGAASAAQSKGSEPSSCWKVLTNDAFDGKVDGIYPLATYGTALKHLPTDIQSYSTIAEVINLARQDSLRQRGKGVRADPSRCGFALGSSSGTAGSTTGGGGEGKGPIPGVIDSVGADKADSFPVALIAIAAIAGLLVLGGGAGFLLRRNQRRQAELEAASESSPADSASDGPRELNP